jgi:hypothetical protein
MLQDAYTGAFHRTLRASVPFSAGLTTGLKGEYTFFDQQNNALQTLRFTSGNGLRHALRSLRADVDVVFGVELASTQERLSLLKQFIDNARIYVEHAGDNKVLEWTLSQVLPYSIVRQGLDYVVVVKEGFAGIDFPAELTVDKDTAVIIKLVVPQDIPTAPTATANLVIGDFPTTNTYLVSIELDTFENKNV